MLQQHRFDEDIRIIGTVKEPVTYTNYTRYKEMLRPDAYIIVVDATVGNNVGTYEFVNEPTKPGGALNTGIEPIGNLSVKAYTGRNLNEMLQAKHWSVAELAHRITTELRDLLSNNKNKDIYRDKIYNI
jgi:hypothetical protein